MEWQLLGRLLTVGYLRKRAETCHSHRDYAPVQYPPAQASLVPEWFQDFATGRRPGIAIFIRLRNGWALDAEVGFQGLYQPYAQGALFRDAQGAVYALFSDGRWIAVPAL